MASLNLNVDYYKELDISQHATSNEIRTAYKRLALVWHPDRNKANDAEEKFKKIKQAYDILSDEKLRREYDQQLKQKNTSFETKSHKTSKKTQHNPFNLHAFDPFISSPIDPFDILNDIQFFQDPDFTYKMMNSPSYRNLYTQIFNSMNNDRQNNRHINITSPIEFLNDRLFRPIPKARSKHHHHHPHNRSASKRFSTSQIPIIHSTMPNDWLLNELIDLYEQQNRVHSPSAFASINNDPFFNDLTHCKHCHKKVATDRIRLIQHEQQCKQNKNLYATQSSKSVRT